MAIGLLIAAGILVVGRTFVFRAAGWALVADDPLRSADIVVVAIDAGAAGVLEAADLVREGVVPAIAVFGEPEDEIDREFSRRGVPYEDTGARALRQLRLLGVASAERIPRPVVGTEDEGKVLPDWCREHQYQAIIVVSSSDHTRRLRRVLHRAFEGRGTTALVRRARYSEFDPDRWWQSRAGSRREVVELEKLLFDILRHPIS